MNKKWCVQTLYVLISLLGIFLNSCTKRIFQALPVNTSCIVNGIDTCAAGKTIAITIDLNDEKQTIHSFGASDAWNMKFIGKNWPVAKRNEMADLLFSKEFDAAGNPKGIGLSLWRFFIGAGSYEQGVNSGIEREYRREECFLKPDGTYDWSKQQGQQWFLKAAKDRGVDYLMGFTCSPPVYFTKNGKAYGLSGTDGGKLNLAPEKYADFAGFLAEVIKHFNAEGLNINYISPFNEPQWDWVPSNPTTEGTGAQNSEIFEAINQINAKFVEIHLPTKIVFGECAAYKYLYKTVPGNPGRSDIINYFWSPSASQYLGNLANVEKVISGHSYFSNSTVADLVSNRLHLNQKISEAGGGLRFWQTEYCILDNEGGMQGPVRDLGINAALHIARVVHNDLVLANAASWQWWLSVSPSDYKDGLLYITDMNGQMGELGTTKDDGIIQQSKILWVLGNFSRFIRPGMIRIESSIKSITDPQVAATKLMISAYKDAHNNKLVIVLINMTNENQKLSLPSNLKLANNSIKTYTTSSGKNLKFAGLNSADAVTLENRSVMTLVCDYQ